MHLKDLQLQVDTWIKKTGKGYFAPLTNLGILTEEVGEVARIMVRKYGEQTPKKEDDISNLADEMADVLWVLAALCNQCNIDLENAIEKNIEKKTVRDINRHNDNEYT